MDTLKHSFTNQVKWYLVAGETKPPQTKAMLNYETLAIAKRLTQAMAEENVSNTELSIAADVSVQAVGDWKRTGKISREKLAVVAKTIRRTTDWLLTGQEADVHFVRETATSPYSKEEDPRKRAMLELWEKLSPDQRDALFRLLDVQTDQQAK